MYMYFGVGITIFFFASNKTFVSFYLCTLREKVREREKTRRFGGDKWQEVRFVGVAALCNYNSRAGPIRILGFGDGGFHSHINTLMPNILAYVARQHLITEYIYTEVGWMIFVVNVDLVLCNMLRMADKAAGHAQQSAQQNRRTTRNVMTTRHDQTNTNSTAFGHRSWVIFGLKNSRSQIGQLSNYLF